MGKKNKKLFCHGGKNIIITNINLPHNSVIFWEKFNKIPKNNFIFKERPELFAIFWVDTKDFILTINERRLQILINETIQNDLECSLRDIYWYSLKYFLYNYSDTIRSIVHINSTLFEIKLKIKNFEIQLLLPLNISECVYMIFQGSWVLQNSMD